MIHWGPLESKPRQGLLLAPATRSGPRLSRLNLEVRRRIKVTAPHRAVRAFLQRFYAFSRGRLSSSAEWVCVGTSSAPVGCPPAWGVTCTRVDVQVHCTEAGTALSFPALMHGLLAANLARCALPLPIGLRTGSNRSWWRRQPVRSRHEHGSFSVESVGLNPEHHRHFQTTYLPGVV